MTDRASLADCRCGSRAIISKQGDGAQSRACCATGCAASTAWYSTVQQATDDWNATRDSIRTPPDHATLLQALLATCDRLGMINRPADAPAAFARVLGEFGATPGACRAAAEGWVLAPVELIEAARLMPRKTPAAGHAGKLHTIGIEASSIWAMDGALKKFDAEQATVSGTTSTPDRYGEAIEDALAAQPSTAENPNEDAYQLGRFDGVMEYAKAILALTPHGDDHG